MSVQDVVCNACLEPFRWPLLGLSCNTLGEGDLGKKQGNTMGNMKHRRGGTVVVWAFLIGCELDASPSNPVMCLSPGCAARLQAITHHTTPSSDANETLSTLLHTV